MSEGIRERAARAYMEWMGYTDWQPTNPVWNNALEFADALMAAGVLGEGERYEQVDVWRTPHGGITCTAANPPAAFDWERMYRRVAEGTVAEERYERVGLIAYGYDDDAIVVNEVAPSADDFAFEHAGEPVYRRVPAEAATFEQMYDDAVAAGVDPVEAALVVLDAAYPAEAAQCPTCRSADRMKRGWMVFDTPCWNPWHSVPPVPESEDQ